jgi:hypothetical protein
MPRRHQRPGRHEQSQDARTMLQEDYPASVKAALLLSLRGGRQPRGCLLCGRRGAWSCKVYVPDVLLRPMTEMVLHERPEVYVLCPACEATQPAVEVIARKLRRQKTRG